MIATRVVQGPGFRICFDLHPEYLRAYIYDGIDSLEVSLAVWLMITKECDATRSKRLLVIEDLLSTVEQAGLEVVIDAIFESSVADIRLAFVELRDDIQSAEFGQILCMERGMIARVFSLEDDARRWLVYGD